MVLFPTAKGITMNLASSYHQTREQIEAEAAEINAARDNPARFAPLYNRYYARILAFVYQRTETKDDAYDVTQQVFITALENLGKYKSQGVPFSAWLFRIALNELSRQYRRAKVRQAVNIDDAQVADVLHELGEENTAQTDARLMQTISKLAPDEVSLLEMRFFEQRAFKEIGDILEVNEAAAKARVYRLLERMKTIYSALV
ncbi:MAG: sigma-70 family RNA polymerase sigma factor [Bacteroidetes bacterium]|nr:sigma-70 family RNA polymerase sigma factor [Bacteroidota bacterium]